MSHLSKVKSKLVNSEQLTIDEKIVNLLLAMTYWHETPKKQVNLKTWGPGATELPEEKQCGAVHCFGGWVATWPEFQKMGVARDIEGAPTINRQDVTIGSFYTAQILFGDSELFTGLGGHTADNKRKSDWANVVERMEDQIVRLSERKFS